MTQLSRCPPFHHLKTETDSFFETLFYSHLEFPMMDKIQKASTSDCYIVLTLCL